MAGSTTLRPPFEHPLLNPQTGRVTEPWHLFFLRLQTANNGDAPADGEYVVGALNSYLAHARLGTNSTSNTWDFATPGQAKVKRAALTGDVTAAADSNSTTIAAGVVTNAKLADMAAHTFKARKTNSTGSPEDATATEATALLDAMVGDSGSGGAKGLVPAPGAGDAAAGKFLDAAGGWSVPSGSGVASVTHTVGIVIDGGGATITTGVKGFVRIPFAGTITSVTLLSTDASVTSGSIVVDIWKDTYANYPPTVADTITASAKPTLSTANKYTDSTLTGWTTSIAAGDVIAFNVDSCTGLTRVGLQLTVTAST